MLLVLFLIVIDPRLLQPAKALSHIVFTPLPPFIDVSFVQPANAPVPMYVTLLPILTDLSPVSFPNAFFDMLVMLNLYVFTVIYEGMVPALCFVVSFTSLAVPVVFADFIFFMAAGVFVTSYMYPLTVALVPLGGIACLVLTVTEAASEYALAPLLPVTMHL